MKTIVYAASDRHGYRLGYLATIKQTGNDHIVVIGEYWKPTKYDAPVNINTRAARFPDYRTARQWSHQQAARAGYPQILREY